MKSFNSRRTLAALLALGALGVVACSDSSDDEAGAGTTDGTANDETATSGGPEGGSDLASVCPNPLVIQTDWFPQSLEAAAFELVGPGGEIDGDQGTYSKELDDTGLTIEIRSGGPYLGNQDQGSIMYQDDEIFLASIGMDRQIGLSGRTPTTSVMVWWEHSPVGVTFDPESLDIDAIEDIADTDATVLYFAGAVFPDFLVDAGAVRPEQLDNSADGSNTRFVADPQHVIMHSALTNEPFRLEEEVEAWGRPVETFLLSEAGFDMYKSLAIRPERLEDPNTRECLSQVVPMLQQAGVDYLNDNTETDQLIIDVVAELNSFWTLSPELMTYAHGVIVENEFIGNGNDDTYGNFDPARVAEAVEQLAPVYERLGSDAFSPDVTAEELYTNDFIDPNIGF